MTGERFGEVDQIFHINVNCGNFDRSLAIYRLVGFKLILDFAATP
jgi:hypothetical protein